MAPRKKKTDDKPQIALLDALEFAAPVFADAKDWPHTHVAIVQGWLHATNGVVSVGYPMGDDYGELAACPQGARMLAALRRCGAGYSLTQTDAAVSVKAGAFRASVPAADASTFPPCAPDANIAPLGEPVRLALQIVEPATAETEPRVVCSSVLLQAGSCVATDGIQLFEAWHGFDLPPDLVLPKKGVALLCKVKPEFAGFGYSQGSVTIWLDNGAWFKIQRYQTEYAPYGRLFPEVSARDVPEGMFAGVKTIADFDTSVMLNGHEMTAFNDTASVECSGLPTIGFDTKRFLAFEPHAKTVGFTGDKAVFYGATGFRGLLMAKRKT